MISELNITSVFRSTNMTSTPLNSVTPVNMHSLVTIKLTKYNYLIWKTQIVPYLCGQHLFGFVDRIISSPSPTIPNPESATSQTAPTKISNPNYITQYDQYQVVLSALVSYLFENIQAQMVGLATSREVWVALKRMFASHSSSHTIKTRQFFASTKKVHLSISDYFQKMRSLSDNPFKTMNLQLTFFVVSILLMMLLSCQFPLKLTK